MRRTLRKNRLSAGDGKGGKAVKRTVTLSAAQLLKRVEDLDGGILVQLDLVLRVVTGERREVSRGWTASVRRADAQSRQDAPHHVRRQDGSRLGVDGCEALDEDVGAIDFLGERVGSVGRGTSVADSGTDGDKMAPVGIWEPSASFALAAADGSRTKTNEVSFLLDSLCTKPGERRTRGVPPLRTASCVPLRRQRDLDLHTIR